MAASSWSWLLSAWVSPGSAWFLFFNVIVGAVAVLSWRQQGGGGGGDAAVIRGKRFTRSASSMVMERLRSMSSSFFFHYAAADYGSATPPGSQLHHDVQEYYCTPSVTSMPEHGPVAAAGQSRTPATGGEEAEAETEWTETEKNMHMCLDQVPRSPPAAATTAAATTAATTTAAVDPAAGETPPRKRRACLRGAEEVEGKAEVNARAERFIRQFREDLKLERINSLLGHRRCDGAAPAK